VVDLHTYTVESKIIIAVREKLLGENVVVDVDTWIKFNQECVEEIGQGANISSPQAVSVLQMVCGALGLAL
jgi:hypothetical protein